MINHNPYYKPEPPYYMTAYGIAVKHGFCGTEEQWLASLKGVAGDPGPGITLMICNPDNTLTIYYGDGQSVTTDPIASNSIAGIELTSGTHAPGTTDTYTIYYTDGDTDTFSVYNGADGSLPPQVGNAGKFLTTDGARTFWATPSGGGGSSDLPEVDSGDNGKFLRVVDGEWAAAEVPIYNGGTI